MDVVLGFGLLIASIGLAVLIFGARQGRFTPRALVGLAAVCSAALVLMLASDWPSGLLSDFWARHPVLEGVLGTLLLVGIGFFAFEVREAQENNRLDSSLTAAGFGGLVDHVVDVEVALALVSVPGGPGRHWPDWQVEQRPLRWLRKGREEVLGRVAQTPNPIDPRVAENAAATLTVLEAWQLALVDQAVRRLLGGIRDWSPVVGRSRNGVELLVTLAFIRNGLVQLPTHTEPRADVMRLRYLCRVLAMHLERNSGAGGTIRSEVLSGFDGIDESSRDLSHLDQVATAAWVRQLQATERRMTDG